jgi:peptide/nickel transport system substrate-binding protein
MIRRRSLLVAAGAMALPAIARGAAQRVLKFIPQSDVTVIDPVWSTAYVSRNHGYLIFDTLFGMERAYQIQPQMLEGAVTEGDRAFDLDQRREIFRM